MYRNAVRCADVTAVNDMLKLIKEVRDEGDSIGGIIEAVAVNVPAGLGEPVFDTLEGDLSKALFSIPAVKGVEIGSGFAAASMRGSVHNDPIAMKACKIVTLTNNSGGISGGISNGMPVILRTVIKPTASISRQQKSVNLHTGKATGLVIGGRHDSCIVPRAVPVVESIVAMVLCDFALQTGLIKRVII